MVRRSPVLGVAAVAPAADPEHAAHDHLERHRLHPRRQRNGLPTGQPSISRSATSAIIATYRGDRLTVKGRQEHPPLAQVPVPHRGQHRVGPEDRPQRRFAGQRRRLGGLGGEQRPHVIGVAGHRRTRPGAWATAASTRRQSAAGRGGESPSGAWRSAAPAPSTAAPGRAAATPGALVQRTGGRRRGPAAAAATALGSTSATVTVRECTVGRRPAAHDGRRRSAHGAQEMGGRPCAQGAARSIWPANAYRTSSAPRRPTSWTASGSPSPPTPAGTAIAG